MAKVTKQLNHVMTRFSDAGHLPHSFYCTEWVKKTQAKFQYFIQNFKFSLIFIRVSKLKRFFDNRDELKVKEMYLRLHVYAGVTR